MTEHMESERQHLVALNEILSTPGVVASIVYDGRSGYAAMMGMVIWWYGGVRVKVTLFRYRHA